MVAYPAGGAPAGFSSLEHQNALAATDELTRGKGARNTTSNDDNFCGLRELLSATMAVEALGWLGVPVAVGAFFDGKLGDARAFLGCGECYSDEVAQEQECPAHAGS